MEWQGGRFLTASELAENREEEREASFCVVASFHSKVQPKLISERQICTLGKEEEENLWQQMEVKVVSGGMRLILPRRRRDEAICKEGKGE